MLLYSKQLIFFLTDKYIREFQTETIKTYNSNTENECTITLGR